MPGPTPQKVPNYVIKQKLLRPALTSNFQCWFNPPEAVRQYYLDGGSTISLLCSDASLPGSSLLTNEINDDYTGITERLGYRKQYDNTTDFTFYVDHGTPNGGYNVIRLFDSWIRYAMNETGEAPDSNYYYRVRYPDGASGYRTEMFIQKFERDFNGNYLEYTFVRAYPIAMSSMPVSHNASELLKCTVSFTYNRYILKSIAGSDLPPEPRQTTAIGVPNPNLSTRTNQTVLGLEATSLSPRTSVSGSGSLTLNRQSLVGNIEPYQSVNGITTPINIDPYASSLGSVESDLNGANAANTNSSQRDNTSSQRDNTNSLRNQPLF